MGNSAMTATSISASQLRADIKGPTPPIVIDVRRWPAFSASREMIGGALRRDPEQVDTWVRALPSAGSVVVYCVHGHEVSQKAAAALAAAGVDRKSTRLNSSHGYISYAVFCLKKKKK